MNKKRKTEDDMFFCEEMEEKKLRKKYSPRFEHMTRVLNSCKTEEQMDACVKWALKLVDEWKNYEWNVTYKDSSFFFLVTAPVWVLNEYRSEFIGNAWKKIEEISDDKFKDLKTWEASHQ